MTIQTVSYIFLAIAFALANLPWISSRTFLFFRLRAPKPLWLRITEWLCLYLITGLLAIALEQRSIGYVHPKGWEFYSIGFFLFLVFAFPGILYQHGYNSAYVPGKAQEPDDQGPDDTQPDEPQRM